MMILIAGLIVILYWPLNLGTAEISVTYMRGYLTNEKSVLADHCGIAEKEDATQVCGVIRRRPLEIKVSALIFIIALFNLIGWTLLSVFGGVGLIALPYDLILEFIYRPKPIREEE